MIRALSFAVIILLFPISLFPDAKKTQEGSFEVLCYVFVVHLPLNNGTPQRLDLDMYTHNLPLSAFLGQTGLWSPVAKRCFADGKCEDATNAKWLLDKGDGKSNTHRISGKYEVNFGAEHIEGVFVAKYQKPRQPLRCE